MQRTERPQSDGYRTATLNSHGFTWQEIAPIALAWTKFFGPGPALEIGACYGDTAFIALENGLEVIANDLSDQHLAILKAKAPAHLKDCLSILTGRFPEQISLPRESLGSVLASSVFHFLPGASIKEGFAQIETWLAPGGKLFLIAETPFMKILENFPYAERKANSEYPGAMTRAEFAQFSQYANQVPEQLNWLDADILRRDLSERNFRIDYLDYFTRPGLPQHLSWDGRESVGLIATRL